MDSHVDDYEVSEETKTHLKQLFREHDADRSGFLSRDELPECLMAAGFSFTEAGYDDILKRFDVNGDGKLSVTELVDNINILAIHSVKGRDIQEAFNILDKDKEGFLRLSKLIKILTANDFMQPEEARKVLSDWMAKYDINQDGRFDYTEFVRMYNSEDFTIIQKIA